MRQRVGTRVTTLSLFAVIVFVLGGLVLADQKLAEEDRLHANTDVAMAAMMVRDYVTTHLAVLSVFHGVMNAGDSASRDRERFLAAVGAMRAFGGRVRGYRRVWIADTNGVVLHDYVFGAEAPELPRGFDLDTLQELDFVRVMADARATGRPQISPPGRIQSGESGIVLLMPLRAGDQLVGFAGGSLTGGALLGGIPTPSTIERNRIVLRSPDGVIAQQDPVRDVAPLPAEVPVEVPGAAPWTLAIEYGAASFTLRVAIWSVGLSVLAVLTLALMHERRQATRIAERSSELERLSGELLAANRAKSEFLANISHELRTPLNAIVGFADLLRDGVYGELGSRQAAPVQRIEASATHLRQLVDQILDLAKITAGRLEVHVDSLDLRPFVLDVASEVEPLINEKQLSLSIAVGATLPKVRTDPSHLRQILVNLLGNAVKYTEQGGVAIRARLLRPGERLPTRNGAGMAPPPVQPARPDATWIALQVVDTGVGIPAEDRERIFEEFEQVNAGPRGDSARRGTGLGLPISRRLARLLGGEVTVDSEPQRGSTFTLWLPAEPSGGDRATPTG